MLNVFKFELFWVEFTFGGDTYSIFNYIRRPIWWCLGGSVVHLVKPLTLDLSSVLDLVNSSPTFFALNTHTPPPPPKTHPWLAYQ